MKSIKTLVRFLSREDLLFLGQHHAPLTKKKENEPHQVLTVVLLVLRHALIRAEGTVSSDLSQQSKFTAKSLLFVCFFIREKLN